MGFSRDSFYRFRDLYEKGGEAALIEMSRRVPNPKNRVAETIERRILEVTLDQPAWGHTRMANELAKEGIRVSPTGVRGVLVRHDRNTMAKRLKALEAKVAQDGLILTEDQLAALEKAKADKEAHGEFDSACPGHERRPGWSAASTSRPSSIPTRKSASPSSMTSGRRSPQPIC